MTAVAYVEASASEESKVSSEAQLEAVHQLATQYGDTIEHVYIDWGKSGRSETRPEYMQMLARRGRRHPRDLRLRAGSGPRQLAVRGLLRLADRRGSDHHPRRRHLRRRHARFAEFRGVMDGQELRKITKRHMATAEMQQDAATPSGWLPTATSSGPPEARHRARHIRTRRARQDRPRPRRLPPGGHVPRSCQGTQRRKLAVEARAHLARDHRQAGGRPEAPDAKAVTQGGGATSAAPVRRGHALLLRRADVTRNRWGLPATTAAVVSGQPPAPALHLREQAHADDRRGGGPPRRRPASSNEAEVTTTIRARTSPRGTPGKVADAIIDAGLADLDGKRAEHGERRQRYDGSRRGSMGLACRDDQRGGPRDVGLRRARA